MKIKLQRKLIGVSGGSILAAFAAFLLGSSLVLSAETQWSVYEPFTGSLSKRWPYSGSEGVVAAGGRVTVDAAGSVAAVQSIDGFDHRSVRFNDFREKSGRLWTFGLSSPDGKSVLVLHRDQPDSEDLFFSVGKDGKELMKVDLGPLPAGSSLDFTLDWKGDPWLAEVRKNGAVIMQKTIPAADVGDRLYAKFTAYNQTVYSMGKIEAGPPWKEEKFKRPFHGKLGTQLIDLGYIPSPWEKATVPPTLEALRKLRPLDLPKHPLALWVADRLARDTGKTPERAAIEEALKGFKRQGPFWIRNDESGFWLSNGQTGYALLPANQGAAIASLYNLQTGTECIFKKPVPGTPWRLRFFKHWPANAPAPVKSLYPDTGKDMSYFKQTDGGPVEAKFEVSAGDHEAKLKVRWRQVAAAPDGDQYAVDATVAMEDSSPLIRWRVDADRVSGSDYTLIGLQFPIVQSLTAPKQSDLMVSWGQGLGHLNRAFESWGNTSFTYPHTGWTLPYFSVSYGPDSTLYLACHDPEANLKQGFVAAGGTTYIEHAAWHPDKMDMSYDVVMAPIQGDWYDAARIYRQWALQQKWCAKGPLWERAQKGTVDRQLVEVDYWMRPNWPDSTDMYGSMCWWPEWLKDEDAWKNGTEEVWANVDWLLNGKLPRFLKETQALPPSPEKPKLGVWWYMWEKQGFDAETPLFDPRPGVSEEFKKEAAAGIALTPYIDIQCWDTEEPTFNAAAKAAASKWMNGKMSVAYYRSVLATICSSEQLLSDTMAKVIGSVHQLGANGIYLDTMPGAGYDWDPSHDHTPGPAGSWDTENQRKNLERIKHENGEQFGITTEMKSEPLMDCLDLEMSYATPGPGDAPLWPAIYGGYSVVSGSTVHPRGPDDIVAFRLKMGLPFIWGSQLGRSCYSAPLLEKDKAIFLRKLVCLRAQAHEFMPYGDMLRPPTLLGEMPRVQTDGWIDDQARFKLEHNALEASLWRSPDGDLGLIIINFDDKAHSASFDAKQVFSERERQASILTSEGEKQWKAAKVGDQLNIEVPPADAILIKFKK